MMTSIGGYTHATTSESNFSQASAIEFKTWIKAHPVVLKVSVKSQMMEDSLLLNRIACNERTFVFRIMFLKRELTPN